MRSALEGVAFAIKQGVEAIVATDVNPTVLRLAGGGTLEPAWKQLLADVLQLPLYSVTVSAASARGAAILAGMGSGVYTTVQAMPQVPLQPQPVTPRSPAPNLTVTWNRYQSLYPQLRDWRDEH